MVSYPRLYYVRSLDSWNRCRTQKVVDRLILWTIGTCSSPLLFFISGSLTVSQKQAC